MANNFKELKKQGLDLLPFSNDKMKVGYKIEKVAKRKGRFEIESEYFTNFFEIDSSTKNEIKDLLNKLNKQTKTKGQIPEITIDNQNTADLGFELPNVNMNLEALAEFGKQVSVRYEGIEMLVLRDETRTAVREAIESSNPKFKEKRIRFIEKLFYAKRVVIEVDKNHAAHAKTKIENLHVDAQISSEGKSHERIVIKNPSNCPFAAKITEVKHFLN